MHFKFYVGRIFILLIVLTTSYGCLSVAKISDFPRASAEIDFDKYATEYKEIKEPFWTSATSNEYYTEPKKTMTEEQLTEIIRYALKKEDYIIYPPDYDNDVIFAKRGMYENEWNSIAGVYYKINEAQQKIQIYINTRITQDFTGGWRENRAKEVGQIIEAKMDSNK